MKIISWNCNGAFRKKFELLESENPDVLVIQECEDPSQSSSGSYKAWAQNYIWIGENKNKGLGIFCKENVKAKRLDWPDHGLRYFIPCRINERFNLLAVWTKNAKSYWYIGQLWSYLQHHKSALTESEAVICGDFNSNPIWDKPSRCWNHSDVVRELGDINLYSIYHDLCGEAHGQESQPTLFMYRDLKKSYHIDYAFASKKFFSKQNSSLVIGRPEDWLAHSDHMPIIFTLGGADLDKASS